MKKGFVPELLRWFASFALAAAAAWSIGLFYWVCEFAGFEGSGAFLAVLVLWTAIAEISFLAGMRKLWGPAAAFWWTVFFLAVQVAWILVVLVLAPLGRLGWTGWLWVGLWTVALVVLARRFRKEAKEGGPAERRSGSVRARVLRAAAAVVVGGVFLMSPFGLSAWFCLYPVLCVFNVDHWFPATAAIELSDVSGPDAGQPGTDAHRLEFAKVVYLCRLHTDVDFSWRVVEDAGPSVRLRFRTCHPWISRRLAKSVKEAYDGQKSDPEARLAADFASWPERLLDDRTLPPSVDLRAPVPVAPPEPVFDGTARLVLAAGTNAVPHLLELACEDGRWYYPVEAHVLLCSILGVSVPAVPDEWCGVRLVRNPPFEDRLEFDKAALAAAWRRYRDTGALPVSLAAPAPAEAGAEEAIARYLRESVAPDYGGEWEHCVPFVRIVATDESDPSDVRAWGEFRVFNYRLEDDTFHFVSGGNHPGLMHLRETDGSLAVASLDPVLDGSEYWPSAKRIFGKHYKAWMALVADDKALEAARLQDLADYAAKNNLPAKFAKDYGWDPVPLPASSRGERGAPAPASAPHRLETSDIN